MPGGRSATLVAAMLVLVLMGCPAAGPAPPGTDRETEDPQPDPIDPENRQLGVGYYSAYNLFDPHKTSTAMGGRPLLALFDGIADPDGTTGEIYPNLVMG